MAALGKVTEVWRYPISSVGGERIKEARLDIAGVVGDRRFALVDTVTGLVASPEREPRWRPALQLTATLLGCAHPLLKFPDGTEVPISDAEVNVRLSSFFGFSVAIGAYAPTEGLPLSRQRHPHAPVHILTAASLANLATLRHSAPLDSRRFRPTFLIDTDGEGFAEDAWVGVRLRLGETILLANEQTRRCGMTFVAQSGLGEEPDILRSILRFNRRNFGIYAAVAQPGIVRLGDELIMEE